MYLTVLLLCYLNYGFWSGRIPGFPAFELTSDTSVRQVFGLIVSKAALVHTGVLVLLPMVVTLAFARVAGWDINPDAVICIIAAVAGQRLVIGREPEAPLREVN